MLSILIPTYNYLCAGLVCDLHQQAERLGIDYEILVADDGSQESFKVKNRVINKLSHCKYIELEENIGRSRIRNLLGRTAQYDYLLFMDCDAEVVNRDFIAKYIAAQNRGKVVYGGLLHPNKLPAPELSLAYKYEKCAEAKNTLEIREKHPYRVFRTFNFMIEKLTFLQHQFDESITKYGHEDTLFGKALQADRIPIIHIDNPLLNKGLDTNIKLLEKTEESLKTLYELRDKMGESSAVLRVYQRMNKLGLCGLIAHLFGITRNTIYRQLTGMHPNLLLFAFYKLGYYCQLCQKNEK
jgi:glycosyltransferase involved in cell wall biosynthesis